MAVRSTLLSTILSRMDRWQQVATIEEQYKVQDLDEALRVLRRKINLPWTLQKSSLKVFDGVLEYPIATDHDELAYLDKSKDTFGAPTVYGERARFRYTSLQQFYENPDDRNDLAEIWDGNERYLGVRYTPVNASSRQIDAAESLTGYTSSGDAGTLVLDSVQYKEGSHSIRVPITSSAGTATVSFALTNSFSDSDYKSKYLFVWVYLDAVPTSVTLRLGNDSSNYLSAAVTTQFSGQAFKADQWNLLAMDLNTATTTGTLDTSAFDYMAVILTGAATGTYYIDSSYLREWELMDYWYYSIYNIALTGSSTANQEYFNNTSQVYSTDSSLIGDSEWIDIVMYAAMETSLADKENAALLGVISQRKQDAWDDLAEKYPDMRPIIITLRHRFVTDFLEENVIDG